MDMVFHSGKIQAPHPPKTDERQNEQPLRHRILPTGLSRYTDTDLSRRPTDVVLSM